MTDEHIAAMKQAVESVLEYADYWQPYAPSVIDDARAILALVDAQAAEIARLRAGVLVQRLGLIGTIDSEDALEIADAMARGDAIDWDQYPEATRKALVRPKVLFASLHNRVLTDAEIDQIIKERSRDR